MNKKTLKNMLWVFGTFIVLGVSYWFCRFGAFDLHGMKQWSTVLGATSLAVLVLSLIFQKHWLSATADLGYIGGFIVALLLNSDGVDARGGRTNNLWIIWTAMLLTCIIIGIVIEIVLSKKKLNR